MRLLRREKEMGMPVVARNQEEAFKEIRDFGSLQ